MDTQKTNQSDTKEPTTFVEWAWLMLRQLWDIIENSFQIILSQQEEIQRLRDENAVLKGEKAKPAFKPSGMEEKTKIIKGSADRENKKHPKRPGSAKKHKTQALTIHNEISQPIPEGSRFKGYRDVVIQDIIIQPNNTGYRLEIWQTPTGEYLCGELPQHLKGSHFGPTLKSFILYQYYHCQVTSNSESKNNLIKFNILKAIKKYLFPAILYHKLMVYCILSVHDDFINNCFY